MPRAARGLADGLTYHIINRGNGRQDVFHKDNDFSAFIELLGEAKGKHPVKVLGHCLMTNYFHLLLSPEKADDLSRFMQWLMTSHVWRYHRSASADGYQTEFKWHVSRSPSRPLIDDQNDNNGYVFRVRSTSARTIMYGKIQRDIESHVPWERSSRSGHTRNSLIRSQMQLVLRFQEVRASRSLISFSAVSGVTLENQNHEVFHHCFAGDILRHCSVRSFH